MAAPGALVISKIVWPETEISETMGTVKLKVTSRYVNMLDAITHGAGEGFKIAMNVIAMLIGFIATIAIVDYLLLKTGHLFNPSFNLKPELDLFKNILSICMVNGYTNTGYWKCSHFTGSKTYGK